MQLADFLSLTKPRVVLMVVVTAFVGFYLADSASLDWMRLLATLVGGALSSGGTMALNQYLERDLDSLMRRTRQRPLPAGRLPGAHALGFGIAITAVGLLILLSVNLASCLLTAGIVLSYLLVYTPLKKLTPISSIVGGIPGALPPVVGWVAASGGFHPLAWLLFAVLFLWQIPHLLAISWLYREDYARAGFRVLPVVSPDGNSTAWLIVGSCVALVVTAIITVLTPEAGSVYLFAAFALSVAFAGCGVAFARSRSPAAARRLLLASYIYLPAVLGIALAAGVSP